MLLFLFYFLVVFVQYRVGEAGYHIDVYICMVAIYDNVFHGPETKICL
jgi:hypothetical protein